MGKPPSAKYSSYSVLSSFLLLRFFSQGYGMHDDHFIAIEEPWSWTQGMDYDGWLPGTKGEASEPSIYSFFYPGNKIICYSKVCMPSGLKNPKIKMFFIRLLLALFSLLVVYYGYKNYRILLRPKKCPASRGSA
jgi:hypothetical protein